jgi:hypothetical protein
MNAQLKVILEKVKDMDRPEAAFVSYNQQVSQHIQGLIREKKYTEVETFAKDMFKESTPIWLNLITNTPLATGEKEGSGRSRTASSE